MHKEASLYNFQYFSPLKNWESSGDYPHGGQMDLIVSRINNKLKGHSEEEIQKLILIVIAMSSKSASASKGLDRIAWEISESEKKSPSNEYLTLKKNKEMYGHVADSLQITGEYDLDSISGDIKITWCEIFALFSLHSVGEAISEFVYRKSQYSKYHKDDPERGSGEHWREEWCIYDAVGHYIFEAFSLIGMSDSIDSQSIDFMHNIDIDKAVKNKISLNNKIAADAKHGPTNKIKNAYIDWHLENINNKDFKDDTGDDIPFFIENDPCECLYNKYGKFILSRKNAPTFLRKSLKTYEKEKDINKY